MSRRAGNPEGFPPDFTDELLSIMKDTEIHKLAFRRARDSGIAQDALQNTYCAIASISPDFSRGLMAAAGGRLGRVLGLDFRAGV